LQEGRDESNEKADKHTSFSKTRHTKQVYVSRSKFSMFNAQF